MRCGHVCTKDVQLAPLRAPARDAAQLMARWNVGTLVVIDETERPIGLVTDRDLVLRVLATGEDPDEVPVETLMTRFPTTIGYGDSVEVALEVMRTEHIRRLPVVREDGSLVGILTLDDVMSVLVDELSAVQEVVEASSPRARPLRRPEPGQGM